MLYLAFAQLPFSLRTVNLKTGVQKTPEYLTVNRWGVVPSPKADSGERLTLRWKEMDSNFWYRGTKVRDLRNIPGIAGGSSTGKGDVGGGLGRRRH